MKKRMFLVITILILSLALLVTGCGTKSGDGGKSADGGKKKLKVGTDATYAPMEFMNEKGEIVGLDIDIVREIAKAAGFEVEFVNIGWEPLFPAVKNSEVDFAVSSITITDERKLEFDFSDPYFYANQLILVPEGSSISSAADLKDKKVSAQINTTGHLVVQDLLGQTNRNILAYETMPLAIQAMLNGDAEASVGDNSVVNEYIKNNPNSKLKTINDSSFEREYYGLMVKKGNTEVVELLNKGIKALKDNGKLKELTGQDVEKD